MLKPHTHTFFEEKRFELDNNITHKYGKTLPSSVNRKKFSFPLIPMNALDAAAVAAMWEKYERSKSIIHQLPEENSIPQLLFRFSPTDIDGQASKQTSSLVVLRKQNDLHNKKVLLITTCDLF